MLAPSSNDTRLHCLRVATGALHEQLHDHALLRPLTRPDITRDDYHWIVRAFHAAYSISEPAHVRQATLPDAPVLDWLNADMAQHCITPVLLNVSFAALDTPTQQLGYLYVKQGSTLGGRVISKNLERHLGLRAPEDNRFFAGYGAATGAQWRQFTLMLETMPDIDVEAMTNTAVESFQLIADCCDAMLTKRRSA